VHITNILDVAYAKACAQYDFTRNAGKLGMLMTVGGSGDKIIELQGLGHVTFTDADGGEAAEDSEDDDDDDDEEEEDDSDGDELSDDEEEDELDDTAEVDLAAASAVGAAVAPEGYELDDSKLGHENEIIGRHVLMKWDGAPIKASDFGWFCGKVKKRLTPAETAKPENADCRFWVTFKNSETGGVLPACIGMSARNCAAAVAAALAPEMRACGGEAGGGGGCRWALLRQSA